MRTVPVALQDTLDQSGRTITELQRIRSLDGRVYGLTTHNSEIEYDDGQGAVIYKPVMNPGSVKTTATLEVDNSEIMTFINVIDTWSTQEIEAGILDSGKFWTYLVNWSDLSEGHVLTDYGTIGIAKAQDNISGVIELRGISQTLKQSIVEQDSLSCRAEFGSQSSEVRFACNFDAESLWQEGIVTAVDPAEPDRVFVANYPAVTGPLGPLEYVPGLLQWQSGDNTLRYIETEVVEDVIADGDVSLKWAMPYDIQIGDSFRIRPDCAKRYVEDCKDRFDNIEWFRGEYLIPVAEERPSSFPGANVPGLGTGIVPGTRA
jgi:uncharacterized phage protein (TIGR02218 family)